VQDAERSGAPDFSMEQVVELFALACIEPSTATSHWTERELADEMVKQCIESPHVMWDDYLEAQLKPHQIRYWLTPRTKNLTPKSVTFQLYMSVIERAKLGERTVCIDEMTGIQASNAPDLPLRPGKVQRRV